MRIFEFDFYFTLVCMVAVLILGRFIISKFKFLRDYNIPEPVVGGLIAAVAIFCLYQFAQVEFNLMAR